MAEAATAAKKKMWTEAEIQSLPDDGYKHEVVNGELIMSPKNNFQHETVCSRLLMVLGDFNQAHRLGVVLGSSIGCWMKNRNCRAPDLSFIPKERLVALGIKASTQKFFPGAPDLAVEVLSPSNTRAQIDSRLEDFFMSGTQIAWVVDPKKKQVEVYHSTANHATIGSSGYLEGENLLPGFRFPVADLFREWEW